MKKIVKLIIVSFGFLLMGSLTGCFSFSKSPPQVKYMFNIPCQKYVTGPSGRPSLQVAIIKVAPAFANDEFVYKINSLNYMTDYYHVFFVPADQQMVQITACYLSSKRIFSAVGDNLNPINNSTYMLFGSIDALYADYQNTNRPKAVVSIRYRLLNLNGNVVLDRTYSRAMPLSQKTSVALVNGWTAGIRQILYALNLDLRSYVARASYKAPVYKKKSTSIVVKKPVEKELDLIRYDAS